MCDSGIILFMEAITNIVSYNTSKRWSAALKKIANVVFVYCAESVDIVFGNF